MDINIKNDWRYKESRFGPEYLKLVEELQFQATNCQECGNYKISVTSQYSVYELADAVYFQDLELCQEIRSNMPNRLRCECLLQEIEL